MKTYITVSDSIGSERVEATVESLNELAKMPEWAGVTFSESFRIVGDDAVDVIVCDNNGEVVAVEAGYENEAW